MEQLRGFEWLIVTLLAMGVFSLIDLIRRRRVLSAACFLGASIGGMLSLVFLANFPDAPPGIGSWRSLVKWLGLQNIADSLIDWTYEPAVIVLPMAAGALVGWWLAREKKP